jgi:uncharacterized protein YjbI with pentapeptide repeats
VKARNLKMKRIITLILVAIMFLPSLVSVASASTVVTTIDHTNWKQRNDLSGAVGNGGDWHNLPLGNKTVHDIGCAVVSTAITVVQLGLSTRANFSPRTLVEAGNDAGAFGTNGGVSSWSTLVGVVPGLAVTTQVTLPGTLTGNANMIQAELNTAILCLHLRI